MSNIPISSLPLAISLDGSEEVPIVQAGTTKRTTIGAVANFPALTEKFVIVGSSSVLPNARTIAVQAGTLTLTDGGAGGNETIGVIASGILDQVGATLGNTLYRGASNWTALTGNITTGIQYLSQTGTGTVSAAPVWATISGGDITGAALTEVNDTNVTLTLGGTPATALLRAASITAGWTGQLSLARGGTNANLTASNGGIFYSTASAGAILAGTATATQMLQSGATAAPAWSTSTWPATTAAGTMLASGAANTVTATATPTLGVNAATGGTLGLANGGGSGATVTLKNLGATAAYNFNLPVTAGSSGQLLASQGGAAASMIWTTATFPTGSGAAGTILRSDGTNWVATTDTYPNTSAAGTILASGTTNTITASATPTLGIAGSVLGTIALAGNTSGTVTITPQAAAGTATFTLPNTSGTPAISVPSPLSLSATTGAVTWSGLTSGGVLYNSSTTAVSSSALLTANALVLGGGAGVAPATLGSLGTTTTVLHGNAAGAPTFGAVSLTADVSGLLTVSNGGTGLGTATAYAVICGGTTSTGAFQSIASVGGAGNVLTSNGPGALPTFQAVAGTGTVTSVTPGGGLTSTLTATAPGSAITGAGTLSGAELINAQTGTSYAIVDGDRAKLITASNAAAQAYTIAQAGAASAFQAGWFVDIRNLGTAAASVVTITPTTSTINGAASLKIQPTQSARIVSDGSNYNAVFTSNVRQIVGTTTNDDANVGNLGEYVSSTVLVGSAVSLSTGVAADVTSISLTAGDWDVQGNVSSNISGGNSVTTYIEWISTTSATAPTSPNNGAYALFQGTLQVGGNINMPTGPIRLSLSATTTVYLSTLINFGGTCSAFGFIGARRRR